jgi:4-hydroxyphenylpyruvate dioxygenase
MRVVADTNKKFQVCLSSAVLRRGSDWRPGVIDPQHITFLADDVIAAASAAKAAGAAILEIPDNYYADLDARFGLEPGRLSTFKELNILYDRQPGGEFLQLFTPVLAGRVFFELVQRVGGYDAFGEANAPVRMAAHRRQGRGRSA